MDAWLQKLLEGIDPSDPHASLLLFMRIMGMIDWWALLWWSIAFTVIGGLIGWHKREFWKGVALGATLGPVGWVVSLMTAPKSKAPIAPSDGHSR
jgi:hypothetical protein